MKQETVGLHLWQAPELPFRRAEILRYAGHPGEVDPDSAWMEELEACIREAGEMIRCRGVWRRYPIRRLERVPVAGDVREAPETGSGTTLDLGFACLDSRSLSRFLSGCGELILFAVTVGWEGERMIARNRLCSPLRGLLGHAVATERVETACDALCAELSERFPGMTAGRFSPGYGDVPLTLQREIFAALDCHRLLGMQLRENLLMAPSKSVTAIAGIKE